MKKIIFLLITLTIFPVTINAQKSALNNIWEITETFEYGDKTRTRSSYITFKDTGEIESSGRDIGTWVQNESENTLTINCEYFEAIKGENKIETLDDKKLKLLSSKGETTILQRMNLPEDKELNNKFTGEWLLEKAEKDGKTDFVGVTIDLSSNGIFYTQGIMFGKWDYNNATNKIFFDVSEKEDEFNGEHTVIKANKATFIIDTEGGKLYFSKIDHEKIAKENGISGLIGTWRLSDEENPDAVHILKFNAPDEFVYVVKTEYSKQKGGGMWIFNKNEKTVLLIGRLEKLDGLNKVIAITNNEISLENNGAVYSLKKEEQQLGKIEHLTYTQDDFFTENGEDLDFKYPDDEQKLPWKDGMEMMMTLVNVKQLVYNYSTLIEAVDVFENETLTADVNSNPQEPQLSIDFIFGGYDRYNLPEDAGLPPNEFNKIYGFTYNKLYPEEDNSFRVVGSEQITTAAGTFDCTVIEAVDGWDHSKKLWMINDKPGIYAKIIDENRAENYGYYHIYELLEIKE